MAAGTLRDTLVWNATETTIRDLNFYHRDAFVALLSERNRRWQSAIIRAIELLVTSGGSGVRSRTSESFRFTAVKSSHDDFWLLKNAELFKPIHGDYVVS